MESPYVVALVGAFFMFVAMPAIISFSIYHEKKLKLQRELARSGGAELQAQLAATMTELERMRERMAVLERLFTDDDRRLAGEIERLRTDQVSPRA
jgi:precorrin-6B methylase 1